MRKTTSKGQSAPPQALDPASRRELHAIAALPDDQVDVSDPDAPETLDWSGAVRGRFYKPIKRPKSLRIDADVLAYFESQGPGYQTRINNVLRQSMIQALRRPESE